MVHKSPIQPDFNRYIPLAGEARGVERMTSQRYARETTVSAEKSRGEIERTLRHYGADQFLYGWEDGKGIIGFRVKGLPVRMVLPLPSMEEFRYYQPKTNQHGSQRGERTRDAMEKAYEQAVLQQWLGHRSLAETERYVQLAGGHHDWVKRV